MINRSRNDYRAARLMLLGGEGPLGSSCTRRVTIDLGTKRAIEDPEVNDIRGRERRRNVERETQEHRYLFQLSGRP